MKKYILSLGLSFFSLLALSAEPPMTAPAYPIPEFSSNELDVIYDHDCFATMEDLVSRARESIVLDFYIFGGPTAESITRMLIDKQRAGVQVRVLLDRRLGTVSRLKKQAKKALAELKRGGIPVLFQSRTPIPPSRKAGTIDHNKYLVIDWMEALIGSMNIAEEFYQYHDLMMHVRGPLARDLRQQFDFDWFNASHPKSEVREIFVTAQPFEFSIPSPEGPGLARIVGTGLGRKTAIESLLPLIDGAARSIHIQMHELGDQRIVNRLIAARDRGVDVRILLDPGKVGKFVPMIHWAPSGVVNAAVIIQLIHAKINVRFYRTTPELNTAHMKSAVIDGNTLFAGSLNWTQNGFETVIETNLEIHGGRAPAQAEAMFQSDWEQSEPGKRPGVLSTFFCRLYSLFTR